MDKPVDFKYPTFPIVESVCQSPPIDPNALYDDSWVKGRCILITGGARGFGAGFTRRWAANGAVVIFCDTNIAGSERLVQDVRKETGNTNVHFIYCDVTDWQSQVELFKKAAWLSPHGGIDAVVANAGVAGVDHFERPVNLDADGPTKPNLKAIEVNLVGVLYTTHLALFWLPRNPGSGPSGKNTDPASTVRDRHMLLVGSMASLSPIPGQTLYGSSKHGVLGLFRNLRAISFIHGIRVNLLCPYFVDTPIFTAKARALLAGGGMGTASDVVEAANRFTCDCRIVGRSLCVSEPLPSSRCSFFTCKHSVRTCLTRK